MLLRVSIVPFAFFEGIERSEHERAQERCGERPDTKAISARHCTHSHTGHVPLVLTNSQRVKESRKQTLAQNAGD